jgi:hypothetical protein
MSRIKFDRNRKFFSKTGPSIVILVSADNSSLQKKSSVEQIRENMAARFHLICSNLSVPVTGIDIKLFA